MSNERRRLGFRNHMLSVILMIGFTFCMCFAQDNVAAVTHELLNSSETLVSRGEMFELGFFAPAGSSPNTYVGIWYYKSNPRLVVWVANRDKPLVGPGGVFGIKDGNLEVWDRNGTSHWSSDLAPVLTDRKVELMDSGNLVLRDAQSGRILWQSFEHPTDTFLPGMKMDENLELTSWTSPDNPSTGNFTFKSEGGDNHNQFLISQNLITYWRSVEAGTVEMPTTISYLLSNFNNGRKPGNSEKLRTMSIQEYNNTRVLMNSSGEIQFWSRNEEKSPWSLIWREPADSCGVYKYCGDFGSCNNNYRLKCKCLPGYVPLSPNKWKSGDFSDGCKQKSTGCGDTFIPLRNMKVKVPDNKIHNQSQCGKECNKTCQCHAYSYVVTDDLRRGDPRSTPSCWVWTEDLYDLQEQYTNGGIDLYIRVVTSDIESTRRNCETCGTNIIPYPLSTGPRCGDPMYYSFRCDNPSGQVSFQAPSGTYPITVINPDTRSFLIQDREADNCDARTGNTSLQLNTSLPFNVAHCRAADRTKSSSGKFSREIEISWAPPGEPTCTSSEDCTDWPSTSCNVSGNGQTRCLCRRPLSWDPSAMNCTYEMDDNPVQGTNKQPPGRSKSLVTIIVATLVSVLVLSCMIFVYIWRRKKSGEQYRSQNAQREVATQLYDSEKRVKELMGSGQFSEEDKKGIDLPFFDFSSILAATDNFSEANKLGKGGFGPVYKGYFPGGQEIAVKRLSSLSGQGVEEFKNEIVLIARLQHRNLVRLLGYCIRGDEKILLYEYMPNRSLDTFLFDESLRVLLDWEMRFNIILGIARGLVYLHQDSRLRIIHRDLKISNILLDSEMNPKISDFGLAKIFEGKQTEGTTNRVVGTYGYMSPEYALDGFFSIKSDVFSFGVVMLEIITGKRNTGFYQSEKALNLLGYAWKMWQENKALDLMEESVRASCSNTNEFFKCMNVGLLCVQEDPSQRPNMSTVMNMLSSEAASLPVPRQPAFVVRQGLSSTASSSGKPESITLVTVTSFHGR